MNHKVIDDLREVGWAIAHNALPSNMLPNLIEDLEYAYERCCEVQKKNGLPIGAVGSAHHILALGKSFVDLIPAIPLQEVIGQFLGGKFIINSFGGFINTPNVESYVGQVHRDVRTFRRSDPIMINMLIMLDDFTLENGATYLLSGSHLVEEKPDEDFFFANAARAVAPAGSILLFDSNVWHAAGKNFSHKSRRALTLTFTPPFVKQQCDYPRMLGYETARFLPASTQQLVGFYSRTPANLEEWYVPQERRMYKNDQG